MIESLPGTHGPRPSLAREGIVPRLASAGHELLRAVPHVFAGAACT